MNHIIKLKRIQIQILVILIFTFFFRLFEIESNGVRNELKIHYIHNDRSHVQAFPVQIADNQWHRVAVTFTHHFVNVYVDCEQVFERQVDSVDLSFIEENDIRLWVAQKNERLGLLQGCAFYFFFTMPPTPRIMQALH